MLHGSICGALLVERYRVSWKSKQITLDVAILMIFVICNPVVLGRKNVYKYCCNVSQICQFKMQFKLIATTSVLFFVAQTMATPIGDLGTSDICELSFMVLR